MNFYDIRLFLLQLLFIKLNPKTNKTERNKSYSIIVIQIK